jgi:hypothetical protein
MKAVLLEEKNVPLLRIFAYTRHTSRKPSTAENLLLLLILNFEGIFLSKKTLALSKNFKDRKKNLHLPDNGRTVPN